MRPDPYDLWRRRRADGGAPEAFADRVMGAVRREGSPSASRWPRLLSSPWVRAAVCLLACLACLFRMASVVAVFFSH